MIKINLLPKREIKRTVRPIAEGVSKDVLLKLALPIGVVVLLVLAVFAYMEITKSSLKKEIEEQKKILAQLQQKIEEVKKFEALNKDIETKTKLIEELKKKQSVPVYLLNTIAKKMPEGIWLTGINFNDNSVDIEGMGFSNLNIVAFVDNLKSVSEFQNVNLTESQQTEYNKVPVYKFLIKFNLKG
ncbi:PilN domain-containing protein [Thermodesulfovibrio sp. 1176]|uniref:PilN domain-containing protein n=1 Tax=Thermodesulfovibrio sp. 1176 TaxID=3043424 RepID=UPI002482CE1A|nr:PilN domain-containing protein [Thermodesulfovibrio sp. 1176]MDI1471122.1 PilN domain-containing protein [Thermodesulfovibrio sp. 1176]